MFFLVEYFLNNVFHYLNIIENYRTLPMEYEIIENYLIISTKNGNDERKFDKINAATP
jgi:hypothetical protein